MEDKQDSALLVAAYIQRAQAAQAVVAAWEQAQVDRAVRAIGHAIFTHAEELARLAVDETGMGLYEDKVAKNRNKARLVWSDLKDKKSVGIVQRDEENGIAMVAKPVGVVAAITPTTNPIVTPMSNAMFAVKGRNAIIITPHHRAVKCSSRAVEYINEALAQIGAPQNLVQVLTEHSRENTRNLIASADAVIATGGAGMVKAAYGSGKPALGVGAGNVQCIVDDDMDLAVVVPQIVQGRSFDNGIICSAEQSIIIPRGQYEALLQVLRENETYVADEAGEQEAITAAIFPDGLMNAALVGQSAERVAAAAGISLPAGTRMIAVPAKDIGSAEPLAREKMFPVLTLFPCENFEEAVEIAAKNLETEGSGHSVCIHSKCINHVEYAALRLPASRFIINQCSATGAGGSFQNGLAATNTLGCGSWGGNSISENLTYKHLLNYSRVAYHLENRPIPTDEEIWAE